MRPVFPHGLFIQWAKNDRFGMNEESIRFLGIVAQPPARLTAEQVAMLLGCHAHDVPVLVTARLLRPLGRPTQNSVKYFAAVEVMAVAKDPKWLSQMTNALSCRWKAKNLRRAGTADRITVASGAGPMVDVASN